MQTILAAADHLERDNPVLVHATELARAFGATLHCVYVAQDAPEAVGYSPDTLTNRDLLPHRPLVDEGAMAALRESLAAEGIEAHGEVVKGTTVREIIAEAKRLQADCIVVGSHRHSPLYELLLGSVHGGVIHHAPCPVYVVPQENS